MLFLSYCETCGLESGAGHLSRQSTGNAAAIPDRPRPIGIAAAASAWATAAACSALAVLASSTASLASRAATLARATALAQLEQQQRRLAAEAAPLLAPLRLPLLRQARAPRALADGQPRGRRRAARHPLATRPPAHSGRRVSVGGLPACPLATTGICGCWDYPSEVLPVGGRLAAAWIRAPIAETALRALDELNGVAPPADDGAASKLGCSKVSGADDELHPSCGAGTRLEAED